MAVLRDNNAGFLENRIKEVEDCLYYAQKIDQIILKEYSEDAFVCNVEFANIYHEIHEHTIVLTKLLETYKGLYDRVRDLYIPLVYGPPPFEGTDAENNVLKP